MNLANATLINYVNLFTKQQMPRIPPCLFRKASHISPHVATLLPICRDLPSALAEFRWIKQHVSQLAPKSDATRANLLVSRLCHRRGRGVPLQYVLQTQEFGPLLIKCRPGVLVPRPETEAYSYYLSNLISRQIRKDLREYGTPGSWNILDLCTGTGCIPLLLFTLLQRRLASFKVHGVDISPVATALSNKNIRFNHTLGHLPAPTPNQSISFSQGDIFNTEHMAHIFTQRWDVLVSNPPYISRDVWNHGRGQLGYSVRKYEPQLALVPRDDIPLPSGWRHEDAFYARLFDIANMIQPKIAVFEVGDSEQAQRVIERILLDPSAGNWMIEVWRDQPDFHSLGEEENEMLFPQLGREGVSIRIRGTGNIRSVVLTVA